MRAISDGVVHPDATTLYFHAAALFLGSGRGLHGFVVYKSKAARPTGLSIHHNLHFAQSTKAAKNAGDHALLGVEVETKHTKTSRGKRVISCANVTTSVAHGGAGAVGATPTASPTTAAASSGPSVGAAGRGGGWGGASGVRVSA